MATTNEQTLSIETFDGNWNQEGNVALPANTVMRVKVGEEYREFVLPGLGLMNRQTPNGVVEGFKRSTSQIRGIINAIRENNSKYGGPEKAKSRIAQNVEHLKKMLFIATSLNTVVDESRKYLGEDFGRYYFDVELVAESGEAIPATLAIDYHGGIDSAHGVALRISKPSAGGHEEFQGELSVEANAMLERLMAPVSGVAVTEDVSF